MLFCFRGPRKQKKTFAFFAPLRFILFSFLVIPAPEFQLHICHKPLGKQVGPYLIQKRMIDVAQGQRCPYGGVVPEAVGFFFAVWPIPVSREMAVVIW